MLRLFGTLIFCVLLSGSSAPKIGDSYRLTGRVLDAQTSQPISNARISVHGAAASGATMAAVYTDAQGYFDTSDFVAVGAERDPDSFPSAYRVGAAAPNPITTSLPNVFVEYEAPTDAVAPRLELFDALGRSIPEGGTMAAGIYFYRLRFESGFVTSSQSLVFGVSSRPNFMLRKAAKRTAVARKWSPSSGDFSILAEKVGYAPETVQIQLTLNSSDVRDFALTASASFNMVADEPVVALQVQVPTTGGTLVVDDAAGPLGGLTLEIPEGSYPDARGFEIGYAPLVEHNFGPNFNPISPVIQIGSGGGYSDSLMTLTIPVDVPEGHFAMAFLYDETTGALEGVPPIAVTDTSITVMSRHFSQFGTEGAAGKAASSSFGNLLVTSISESILNGQTIVDTGYKPGTDDWEFVNRGSYIALGGHCAGQSVTSMWYYYEQKLAGQPGLHGRFDTVDNLEYDNPRGYRFASVIQEDIQWDSWLRKALRRVEDETTESSVVWNAFIYSMLLTGEPQYVGIHRDGGGHAIVAYKVSVSEGKLYVADPNYPTQVRTIDFRDGKLQPYESKQNANEAATRIYPRIGYYAKTALVDWDKVGTRWAEMMDKSIGTVAPNAFPAYTLKRRTPTGYEPLPDSMETEVDTMTIIASCPTCQYSFSNDAQHIWLYRSNGDLITKSQGGEVALQVPPGKSKIGAYVTASKDDHEGVKTADNYIDFKWLTIQYVAPIEIVGSGDAGAPVASPGNAGIAYTLKALTTFLSPANARYEWQFGDGSDAVTVLNDSTVQHTYDQDGTFLLKVSLYNLTSGDLVAKDSAQVEIRQTGKVTIPFSGLIEAGPNWAPYTTPVEGTWTLQGPGAVIAETYDAQYILEVMKNEPATLTLSVSRLEPLASFDEDSTDTNGVKWAYTYKPPYQREDFDFYGTFAHDLVVTEKVITASFTFTGDSGQSMTATPEICYDLRVQVYYPPIGDTPTFDNTHTAWRCKLVWPQIYVRPASSGKRDN